MANPLLDAIKQMKAKRVAIVVGDADELGLPDMVQGVAGDDTDSEEPGEESTDPLEMKEDAEEGPEVPGEAPDAEDMAEGEDPGEAEQVMGRKPFDKNKPAGQAAQGEDDGMSEDMASKLYDPEMVDKMRASGKKPNGLMARAQMGLAKRFGK